jgi:hypothetical protein
LTLSCRFGFGVPDALAAVEAAKTWQSWGPEQQIIKESVPVNGFIPNTEEGALFELFISSDEVAVERSAARLTIESVVVYLELE